MKIFYIFVISLVLHEEKLLMFGQNKSFFTFAKKLSLIETLNIKRLIITAVEEYDIEDYT